MIQLSKRNLLALLSKLEQPNSKRSIIVQDDEGHDRLIQAVLDEVKYAERFPGPMSHATEEFIRRYKRNME